MATAAVQQPASVGPSSQPFSEEVGHADCGLTHQTGAHSSTQPAGGCACTGAGCTHICCSGLPLCQGLEGGTLREGVCGCLHCEQLCSVLCSSLASNCPSVGFNQALLQGQGWCRQSVKHCNDGRYPWVLRANGLPCTLQCFHKSREVPKGYDCFDENVRFTVSVSENPCLIAELYQGTWVLNELPAPAYLPACPPVLLAARTLL
jgi:hypothetical protein